MRIGMSAFCQAGSATHSLPFLDTANAVVGSPLPETITIWPYTTGVIELVTFGTDPRDAPRARRRSLHRR